MNWSPDCIAQHLCLTSWMGANPCTNVSTTNEDKTEALKGNIRTAQCLQASSCIWIKRLLSALFYAQFVPCLKVRSPCIYKCHSLLSSATLGVIRGLRGKKRKEGTGNNNRHETVGNGRLANFAQQVSLCAMIYKHWYVESLIERISTMLMLPNKVTDPVINMP